MFKKLSLIGIVAIVGCNTGGGNITSSPPPTPPAPKEEKPRVVRLRPEFETLVIGKRHEDVDKLLGTADKIECRPYSRPHLFRYLAITRDPKTDRVDVAVDLHFKGTDVERVEYEAAPADPKAAEAKPAGEKPAGEKPPEQGKPSR